MENYTLAPSCLVACRMRSATTTWGIVSCSQLNSPWRSGAIGLKGLSSLSRFSQTTSLWNISSRLSGWTLGRPDGPCFLIVSSFSLSYRPGTKNVKPDALSRAYSPETQEKPLASIIPRSRIVAVLQWELERVVREAQAQEPDPGGGPACTSLNLPGPGSCSGVMSLPWHAIQEMLALLTSSSGSFGGRPSRRTLRSMWRPALCAARESLHISDLRDCSIHYPFPVGHGRTFLLTLSRDSHHPKATLSSKWFWTGSLRPHGSFPCRNCLRPKRQQSSSWTMSSGCLVFPWILSPTEGPSSRPGSGGPSASWLGPQPAYRLGSIQSLMARWNG